MQRQNGFTLITLLFLLGLAVIVAMVAFKVVPTYMDYFAVRNSLENILKEDELLSNESIRASFAKRLDVNFIQDITPQDLEIDKEDGMLTLTVPISSKKHLVAGVSISVDLEATASTPLKQ